MPRVTPLHHVTIEYRLDDNSEDHGSIETSGRHCFLYGIESWIDGVDQKLEGLEEGEHLELILDSEAAARTVSHLLPLHKIKSSPVLQVRIVKVIKAEPSEVVKALAATVHCCDHCGDH